MDAGKVRSMTLGSGSGCVALELVARSPHPMEQPRLALWIGAGLATGLVLATLSPRQWSRLGALVFGAGAWMLRSPIGPALVAALLARATANTGDEHLADVVIGPTPPSR